MEYIERSTGLEDTFLHPKRAPERASVRGLIRSGAGCQPDPFPTQGLLANQLDDFHDEIGGADQDFHHGD
jgi:hypothetical protein